MRQSPSNYNSFSERLKEIRRIHYGVRGRSSFARDLGIPVTSYVHYEEDRPPPAEVLVKAAGLTGTRIEWLLTGEGPRDHDPSSFTAASIQIDRLVNEIRQLLNESPDRIAEVEQFIHQLKRTTADDHFSTVSRSTIPSDLIPVVGSTAAGLAHFWDELETAVDGREADAQLERILEEHFHSAPGEQIQDVVSDQTDSRESIALVQYSQPDERGFLEFLSAGKLKSRYPQAVAWRIDGESMSPRFCDGDFVLTSPDQPAIEMQPCVARQFGQIGVNCKLFRSEGDQINLIPINEAAAIQRFPAHQLLWAWRVLASVRLK